ENSTTMAYVRALTALTRDKTLSKHIVPIVPDEARTFGMEGMFRQVGIYSSAGQLYTPQDADQLMFYKEDKKGQILQEGINEAGATCSFIAAGTSYANYGVHMIPFYAFYSMFGFQRVGDFVWAAADSRARGFLIGATAGRTTLAGEGLQHMDGHSHVLFSVVPTCRSYDPAYAYELAVIIQDGIRRMYQEGEEAFYYITVMNENYPMPAMPEGVQEGIVRGMYLLQPAKDEKAPRVQLLGSGTILREVLAAAELLLQHGVHADVWSVTSFVELARQGDIVSRRPPLRDAQAKPEASYVEQCLGPRKGPVVAATDYIKLHADSIRAYVPRPYYVLGTDGFGRSDTREGLRRFFEVDRNQIAFAALRALVESGDLKPAELAQAQAKYGIDPNKQHPLRM
ncbi:MAG TPA: pyruvate dehydrogenase (acetyl-transferring), homodimeric type, partial [Polyangiales bacterium]|nr:pyruvate dehydrogenase (acetyl-transferring), homodimeric type [Polyangiales bacterium]